MSIRLYVCFLFICIVQGHVLKSEVVGIECLFSSNDQFLIKIYRRIRKSWVHILKMKSATLCNFDVNVPTSPIAYIKK